LDTDYQEAIILLVELYKKNYDYLKIIELLTEIKKAGANDPVYDWELAKAYSEEELYEKALEAFKEASTHLSHDSEFLKEYGYFLTEEGLVSDAISILEKYIALEPLDEDTISFIERLKFSING